MQLLVVMLFLYWLPRLFLIMLSIGYFYQSLLMMLSLLGSFLISIPFTLIFYFIPEFCLKLLYNTTSGANYLKYMAIPFTIFYLQTPLSALLQALNRNKLMFISSIIECTSEIILVYVLSHYLGVFSIAISLLVGLLITLIISAAACYKYLFISN